jgi:hypothetical protein
MLLHMLGPEHDLSERVEQLFHVRYDGPDACPQGYEEADGEEYASAAAAVGQRILCSIHYMTLNLHCRWTEERLFSLYHRCGRGRALHAHCEADGLAVAALFPQDILARHARWY